jgi:hypothetical protein
MAVMLGLMIGANEATKETHAKSGELVDTNMNPIATSSVKRFSTLRDLPAQSMEFLESMNYVSVVLAENGVVGRYAVQSFLWYNNTAMDIYIQAPGQVDPKNTVAKVVIRMDIAFAEAVDGCIKHIQNGAAPASRVLAAREPVLYTRAEMHAAHAAAHNGRSLSSYENPLLAMYGFFGGVVESNVGSDVAAGIQGTKDPYAPPRPSVPALSEWDVLKPFVDEKGENEKMVSESWFMDTTVADKPRFKFVTKTDSMVNDVMEVFGGKVYTYKINDKARMLAMAQEAGETPEHIKVIEDMSEFKEDCKVEILSNFTMTADSLRAKKINENMQTPRCQFEDGSAEYAADGYWTLVGANGDVKEIGEIDIDGKLEGTSTKVLSIVAASGDEFQGCDVSAKRRMESRSLGWMEDLSNTEWCGAGTDNANTPCPGTASCRGDPNANHACRRHDHGRKHAPALGGVAVKLECEVDRELADAPGANWAAVAAFGRWGVANAWGCDNYRYIQNCWWHWAGCGWRGCPGWQRRCSGSYGWESKNGPWRYSGVTRRPFSGDSTSAQHRYKPKAKVCSGDIW